MDFQLRRSHVERTPWTPVVWLVLWVSMMTGMLKGYSSGPGVLYSSRFRAIWFHSEKLNEPDIIGANMDSAICKMADWDMTWFMASKYVVGSAASLPVGWLTRVRGRRLSIWLGCAAYCIAHLLQGAAVNAGMLIAAQVFHGLSAAFLYQAPYIEAVEIAPPHWRGVFVFIDPLGRGVGLWTRSLLHAGLANETTSPPWGWRLTSLFPLWPAAVVMLLVPWIPETPNSLIQRGKLEAGRAALQEIRGLGYDVDDEFEGILQAAGIARSSKESPSQLRTLLKRDHLPPLLLMLVVTVLREFTGADFVRLFSRPFWDAMRWTRTSKYGFALEQVQDGLYIAAVVASMLTIDRWGRRPTLIIGSVGCGLGFVGASVGIMLQYQGTPALAATICFMLFGLTMYVFGWAGGFWLLAAELFPLATRSLAGSLLSALVFMMYAITSSYALSLMCRMRAGMFMMYAGGNLLLLLVVVFFLPETSGAPLEEIQHKFQQHRLWRHFKRQQRQPGTPRAAAGRAGRAQQHPPPPPPRPGSQAGHGSGGLTAQMQQYPLALPAPAATQGVAMHVSTPFGAETSQLQQSLHSGFLGRNVSSKGQQQPAATHQAGASHNHGSEQMGAAGAAVGSDDIRETVPASYIHEPQQQQQQQQQQQPLHSHGHQQHAPSVRHSLLRHFSSAGTLSLDLDDFLSGLHVRRSKPRRDLRRQQQQP